jgi:hypothetical protein
VVETEKTNPSDKLQERAAMHDNDMIRTTVRFNEFVQNLNLLRRKEVVKAVLLLGFFIHVGISNNQIQPCAPEECIGSAQCLHYLLEVIERHRAITEDGIIGEENTYRIKA